MKACYTVKSHLTRPQTLTAVKVSKLSPPLCFGHTTANHLPTPQCGFTLIGDQKRIIIQLYTGAGKIANEGMLYCKISLNEATNSNCS